MVVEWIHCPLLSNIEHFAPALKHARRIASHPTRPQLVPDHWLVAYSVLSSPASARRDFLADTSCHSSSSSLKVSASAAS